MNRIALVATYLAVAALTVVLYDANTANQLETVAVVAWAFVSLMLGWGTGQPLWALLVVLVIAFAKPFGAQDPPIYHDAVSMTYFAVVYGVCSAALIVVSAVARIVVDWRRRSQLSH
jgi:hypothetical protein